MKEIKEQGQKLWKGEKEEETEAAEAIEGVRGEIL